MQFRAVIYSIDHSIDIVWVKDRGNWFTFNGRSYRKDRDSICQVLEKGNRINNKTEAIYIEGNPRPLRSNMDIKTMTDEHNELKHATVTSGIEKKGFLARLLGV